MISAFELLVHPGVSINLHETEQSRIYAFLGSFGVNFGCSGYEILHETENFEIKEGQDGPVV